MPARRGKSQARRNQSNGLPGWAWLVIGVVLTLLVVVLAMRYLKPSSGDGFLRVGPTPNPDAQPAPAHGDAIAADVASDAPKAATDAAAKPTRYDFYTLLPGEGVQMTDAELAASAKAEAAARAKDAQSEAADTAASAQANALPTPIDEATASASTTSRPTATTAEATPASNPAAGAASSARYILQAGAFGASGDAESLKARIAMLGLSARVESAHIGDKTVYRVRMGPYGTASELAEAKAKLSGGGLPAMAIKAN